MAKVQCLPGVSESIFAGAQNVVPEVSLALPLSRYSINNYV